jgi:hypothetical protein
MPFTLRVTTFSEKTVRGSETRGETITNTKQKKNERQQETFSEELVGIGCNRKRSPKPKKRGAEADKSQPGLELAWDAQCQ